MAGSSLIVCYTFPPYPGIGGRRWAKFAKYLRKQREDVFVLTAKRRVSAKKSLWLGDIKDFEREHIYAYRHFYPLILQQANLDFLQRIRYKVAYLFVKLFSRGNPFDRATFDKENFLSELSRVVLRHDIKNIIVTAAPFNLLYYCALYKRIHPQINLIVDFRDPWTWGMGYGFSLLNQERIEEEKRKEREVLFVSDKIFVPGQAMKEKLNELYPMYASKIEILPHCFDSDDIDIHNLNPQRKVNHNIHLIYGGTLYNNTLEQLEDVAITIKNFTKTQVQYHLYLLFNPESVGHLKSVYRPYLVFEEAIDPRELFKRIKMADYYVAIFPDEVKDFISTKFYEIISLKVPIIIISNNGLLSEFIVKNRLGYHVLPKQIQTRIRDILEGKDPLVYNNHFDLSEYSFEYQTRRLTKFLN